MNEEQTEALTKLGELIEKPGDLKIDELEQRMLATGKVIDLPLIHRFTPGLYVREIFMPRGSLVTSKIHKTEHPYVVLEGRVSVYNVEDGSIVHLTGGHVGITKPGTRRVLYMHEDTRWATFHPIAEDEQGDLEKIEARIIEQRILPSGESAHGLYLKALRALDLHPVDELTAEIQEDYGGAP